MHKIILFGARQISSIAKYYIDNDTPDTVSFVTVDDEYYEAGVSPDWLGETPLIPLSEAIKLDKNDYKFFTPLSPNNMNSVRQDVHQRIKRLGFEFYTYISSRATVFGSVGVNSMILEDNVIQPFSEIGDGCILWSGNHIGHHTTIGDFTMLSSHVVVSGNCQIGNKCYFGVNSAVRDGILIADNVYVGMCGVVTKNLTEGQVVPTPKQLDTKVSSSRLKW